jgi:hypothetical protein
VANIESLFAWQHGISKGSQVDKCIPFFVFSIAALKISVLTLFGF